MGQGGWEGDHHQHCKHRGLDVGLLLQASTSECSSRCGLSCQVLCTEDGTMVRLPGDEGEAPGLPGSSQDSWPPPSQTAWTQPPENLGSASLASSQFKPFESSTLKSEAACLLGV